MSERSARWVLGAALLLLGAWIGHDYVQLALYSWTEPRAVTPRGELTDVERNAVEVFEQASPSVVFVTAVNQHSPLGLPRGQVGMGSGFVWDPAGHIVTNDHVVRGAERIAVRFGAGRLEPAVVIGRAPDYDLAVIRVQSAHRAYRPLPLGSAEDLRVGQAVFAIGNPFGLSRTLTQGLVSALERQLPTGQGRDIEGVIQTDAAINPGNSGGPLLDSAGRLIGVNTAIASHTGAFVGIGFAVPVDVVNRVVGTLIRDGSIPRPGIGIAALTQDLASELGSDGVVIAEVLPDSPAERAGLRGLDPEAGRFGDTITHVDGEPVATVADLVKALEKAGIGSSPVLRVRRAGEVLLVQVEVVDIGRL
jgi:2-alkenal reductase